jgi:methyl-accepting chemotaxis protein
MNFGSRVISMFNRAAPKIARGIGQVAEVGRNIGQVVKHSRNIGSIANQISGGRLSQSPIAQKMQDVANKIESGANFVSGNEDRAQNALSTISRKFNA